MGATYTRQTSFTDGDVITAGLFNDEYDQLLAAFASSTGHTHDGTTAEGGPISKLLADSITLGTGAGDISFNFNAGTNDGVLTWSEDEDYFTFSDDILMATAEKIQFRDTAIFINSSADGQLDIVADTEIQIAATTIDMNGILDVSGNLLVGGNLTVAGDATVTGTTTFNGGTITLGDAVTDNVVFGADVNSSIIPNGVAGSFDLGSSGQEWRDIFINGTAHIDTLDVDENATVTGTLGVTGVATFTDDIIIGDGKTIGSASDVDAITIAANGQLTLTQTLIGTALDISGDIDVDGTTNLDVVDIDGAVDMATTLVVAGNVDFNGDLDVAGTANIVGQTTGTGGTLSAPTYSFIGDTDTGISRPTTDAVNIVTGGTERLRADSGGVDVIGSLDVSVNAVIDGTALVTGVLTTTAATVFNGGFASNADSTMGTNKKLIFRDSAIHISSVNDGDLMIVADDEIDITSTLIDINGNVEISGTTAQVGVLTTTATQVATGGITSGSDIVSDTDSTDDLGTTSVRWANLFVDGITATDQITATGFTGTLDGILGSGAAATASVTTLDTSGAVNLNLATDSTSSTSGALIIDGGVGIAKKLFVGTDGSVGNNLGIGNNLTLDSDGAIVTFGANAEVTLTHVHDTGLLLNSTMALQFNDASQFIKGTSATVLSIGATAEIDLTATAIDINGTLDVSGAVDIATTLQVDGVATFTGIPIAETGLSVKNGSTTAGFVSFFEDSSNGTNSVKLIGPASTADVTLTLPAVTGTLITSASAIDEATALAIALG